MPISASEWEDGLPAEGAVERHLVEKPEAYTVKEIAESLELETAVIYRELYKLEEAKKAAQKKIGTITMWIHTKHIKGADKE